MSREGPPEKRLAFEPGSFRDRDARIVIHDGAVYRLLSERALADWRRLEKTQFFAELVAQGKIVATEEVSLESLPGSDGWAGVLRHETIPFISHPYEWSFAMLRDAALLQLELLDRALGEGMILKDSTPYNIQWRGSRPVFIDVSSFEEHRVGEPWAGYRQFCEMFLNPLLIQAHRDIAFQPWLRGRIDGIPVAECAAIFSSLRDRIRAGVFSHVWLHAKAERRSLRTDVDEKKLVTKAGFHRELIRANVRGLKKLIGKLEWRRRESVWSEYEATHSYEADERAAKEAFVREAIERSRPQLVWDLGCNTGIFSRIAADGGARVVACDSDHLSVERLYLREKERGGDRILPLVINLSDPSPGLGWRGLERRSLAGRGKPDLVLALALIHHLVIGANIPLVEVLDWLASLDCDLVIEWIDRDDPMVQRLLRPKTNDYADYQRPLFEELLRARWEVRKTHPTGRGVLVEAVRR